MLSQSSASPTKGYNPQETHTPGPIIRPMHTQPVNYGPNVNTAKNGNDLAITEEELEDGADL